MDTSTAGIAASPEPPTSAGWTCEVHAALLGKTPMPREGPLPSAAALVALPPKRAASAAGNTEAPRRSPIATYANTSRACSEANTVFGCFVPFAPFESIVLAPTLLTPAGEEDDGRGLGIGTCSSAPYKYVIAIRGSSESRAHVTIDPLSGSLPSTPLPPPPLRTPTEADAAEAACAAAAALVDPSSLRRIGKFDRFRKIKPSATHRGKSWPGHPLPDSTHTFRIFCSLTEALSVSYTVVRIVKHTSTKKLRSQTPPTPRRPLLFDSDSEVAPNIAEEEDGDSPPPPPPPPR